MPDEARGRAGDSPRCGPSTGEQVKYASAAPPRGHGGRRGHRWRASAGLEEGLPFAVLRVVRLAARILGEPLEAPQAAVGRAYPQASTLAARLAAHRVGDSKAGDRPHRCGCNTQCRCHQGIGDRYRMPCPIEQGPTRGITMQMLNPNPIPAGDLWSGHRKQGVGHRCQARSTAPARPLRPKALLDQRFEAMGTKAHHAGDKRFNRTGNLKVLDKSCDLQIPPF